MLKEMLEKAETVFVCEYRGLTVAKITDVRARIRKAGGEMKIARNTLMRLALGEMGHPVPEELTAGPNVYTLVYGEIADGESASRLLQGEGDEALVVKGGIMGKDVLNQAQVFALADLPSRNSLSRRSWAPWPRRFAGWSPFSAAPPVGWLPACRRCRTEGKSSLTW